MIVRYLLAITAISGLLAAPAGAQEALVTYKSLSPELAQDLARAALADCRKRGFQVTVAVVDRFGVTQVLLRDRFAGPHTVSTASGKAWTAASFRTSTTELNAISQPGMMQAGIRQLPGAVIVGGGVDGRGRRLAAGSRRRLRSPRRRCGRGLRQGGHRRRTRQAGLLDEPIDPARTARPQHRHSLITAIVSS